MAQGGPPRRAPEVSTNFAEGVTNVIDSRGVCGVAHRGVSSSRDVRIWWRRKELRRAHQAGSWAVAQPLRFGRLETRPARRGRYSNSGHAPRICAANDGGATLEAP